MSSDDILFVSALAFVLIVLLCMLAPFILLSESEINVINNSKERIEVRNDARKTMAQILTAPAIIFAFVLTYANDTANQINARETLTNAREALEETKRSVELTEQSVAQARRQAINQQFADAARLIGSENLIASSAGVQSLVEVARQEPEYHTAVIKTLVGYVNARSFSHAASSVPPRVLGPDEDKPCRVTVDIQATIDALSRREREHDKHPLAMNGAWLVGATFYGQGAGFRGSSFVGSRLMGADLRGLDLTYANFSGSALNDYDGWVACNTEAWVDDTITRKEGWAKWRRFRYIANFEGATLTNTSFIGAGAMGTNFRGANLEGACFAEADVSRADFREAVGLTPRLFSVDCVPEDDQHAAKDNGQPIRAACVKKGNKPIGLPAAVEAVLTECSSR